MKRMPIIWTDRYGFGITRSTETIYIKTSDERYAGKGCDYRHRLILVVGRRRAPLTPWRYTDRTFIEAWVKRTVAEEIDLAAA